MNSDDMQGEETQQPNEAHLHCIGCDNDVTVARLYGDPHLVCHCTGVDSDVAPVPLYDATMLPSWIWESHGGGS